MTDKVYHSFDRTYRSRAAATAIQYAGGSEGWVVPSTERLMDDPEGDLATGSLNAFGESHSASSFDVTIDTGEALVGGAYLARDTTTTVTLSSSTTGQTVYVGWGDSQTDTVIIGLSGAFGSNDPKIPIWTFDTDGSGVTSATDERVLSQREASLGGGIQYVQSTEPEYSEGSNWIDPSTGIYYGAYDDGSGGDWHPIPPVTVLEEAVDFTESDVSVSHNKTDVSSGSVELSDVKGSAVSRPSDESSASSTNDYGLIINPNEELAAVYVIISSKSDNTSEITIRNHSSGDVIATKSVNATSGDEIRISADLQASTEYEVVASGDSTKGYTTSTSFPYTGTELDIVDGIYGGSRTSYACVFSDVAGGTPASSGSATVSWPSPSDIKSWDLATFQRTLANETVTIDVLDGAGNVLFSDISQNFDISTVSDSTNVQVRANLSRNDTANNPTWDYAARRFTR